MHVTESAATMGMIVVFGDSITNASTEMPETQRWPLLLEQALKRKFPTKTIRVVNAGVGGNTSREGLARLEKDVLRHKPDCVVVQFGGNDATPEPNRRVSLDEYRANLDAMRKGSASVGAKMVLATFPPIVDRNHVWWYAAFKDFGGQDAFVEQYREITRRFAEENGLGLIDLDRAIRRNPDEFILKDGVHLTAEGNKVTAELVFTHLTAH